MGRRALCRTPFADTFLFLSATALPQSVPGAPASFSDVANQIAKVLRDSATPMQTSVFVWACPEPRGPASAFGDAFVRDVVRELSTTLGDEWSVGGRELEVRIEANELRNRQTALEAARRKPHAFLVSGLCEPTFDEKIKLALEIVDVVLNRRRGRIEKRLALGSALGELLSKINTDRVASHVALRVGVNGVSPPICFDRPKPETKNGMADRTRPVAGMIVLRIVVTADGRTHRVGIVESLDPRVDEKIKQDVSGWRFVPARDPDGNPVPSWFTLELNFRAK